MLEMTFLIVNLAIGFYAVGIVWANEIDIYRSWQHIHDTKDFRAVWHAHWTKLWAWGLIPVGLEFAGSIGLLFFHPAGSPAWAIWGNFTCQLASAVLTVPFWERWQARLYKDPLGARSPYLAKILKTHWVRASLTTVYAVLLLAWVIIILS
ncbi:MAG: hypothetical protein JW839_08230 [Candidatus Lokiarchaeota archaeon]|nr:hypothetical protein [Candidatus Lokiarchaeota archaeon]